MIIIDTNVLLSFLLTNGITRRIIVENPDVYKPYISDGEELTDDKEDAPIIALALSMDNEGIWTYNTKHFRQEVFGECIRVLSTKDVIKLYPLK